MNRKRKRTDSPSGSRHHQWQSKGGGTDRTWDHPKGKGKSKTKGHKGKEAQPFWQQRGWNGYPRQWPREQWQRQQWRDEDHRADEQGQRGASHLGEVPGKASNADDPPVVPSGKPSMASTSDESRGDRRPQRGDSALPVKGLENCPAHHPRVILRRHGYGCLSLAVTGTATASLSGMGDRSMRFGSFFWGM